MKKRTIAFFCMPELGHFNLLRALISDLASYHLKVYVYTHRDFESSVRKAGGIFVDLFGEYPVEHADNASIPVPCRYVSYAGYYAEKVRSDLERIQPSLVIYETFSVVGRVVAALLDIPYVNVSPGHNIDPAKILPALHTDPRLSISSSCHRAVDILRERYTLHDASPFSYITSLSPFLNIYCEPSGYLTKAERRVFEPIAFYGSLPSAKDLDMKNQSDGISYFGENSDRLKLYASFGTVVWRYYAHEAISTLEALSAHLGRMQNATALISLGNAQISDEALRMLTKPNVRVEKYVDQSRVLQEASVFVTHHGINSTHESVYHGVPMISYPFFADQPALASKCQQLGFAVPLTDSPRGRVSTEHVNAAITLFERNRESLSEKVFMAREWEREVITSRDDVLQQIMALI